MKELGQKFRERARQLGLADSIVAERLGLSQQRYHNYISGQTEPDLQTLVRICKALATEPNDVLGFSGPGDEPTEEASLQATITAATSTMSLATLRLTAAVVNTLAKEEKRVLQREAKPLNKVT